MSDVLEVDEGWEVQLSGSRVSRCCVDKALRLAFREKEDDSDEPPCAQLVIWTRFRVRRTTTEDEVVLDPTVGPLAVAPALALWNESLDRVLVRHAGQLCLTFSGGASLTVNPDHAREAWELGASDGLVLVCVPGGGTPRIWTGREPGDSTPDGAGRKRLSRKAFLRVPFLD